MVKKNLKKQKGVIIVYPSSRTRNLIKEIRNLGYVPIVIPTSKYDKFVLDMFDETCIQQFNSAIKSEEYKKYNPDIVEFDSDQDVNKIIKYTKNKYEILAVIPCSDPSLKISDCLQKEFKLISNPKEWVENAHDKNWVNQKIIQKQIRAIKTKVITKTTDINQIIKYFDNSFPLFIKPISGGGSVNAYKVTSAEDLKNKIKIIYSSGCVVDELILQEFVQGELYVVNFFTIDGVPNFIDMLSGERTTNESGAIIWKNHQLVNTFTPSFYNAIQYVSKTITACGHKNGFVHSEIMIDSKGPVLIEHNWRTIGGLQFLNDKIINEKYNENSLTLMGYLAPNKIKTEINNYSIPKKHYAAPIINNYCNTGIMLENYLNDVLKNLASYTHTYTYIYPGYAANKVNNLDDCIAMVDLQHLNEKVVLENQKLIWEINETTPEVFFTLKGDKPIFINNKVKKDLTICEKIKNSVLKCKRIIFFNNETT